MLVHGLHDESGGNSERAMANTASHLENRGSDVLGVNIAVLCVSTIFVILRLVSRVGVVKRVTLDDYFIILAWVSEEDQGAHLMVGIAGLNRSSSSLSGSPSRSVTVPRSDLEDMKQM